MNKEEQIIIIIKIKIMETKIRELKKQKKNDFTLQQHVKCGMELEISAVLESASW